MAVNLRPGPRERELDLTDQAERGRDVDLTDQPERGRDVDLTDQGDRCTGRATLPVRMGGRFY